MIEFCTSDLEQSARQSDSSVYQAVDRAFQYDDRLLSSLQKLARELEPENPQEDEAVEALRTIWLRWVYVFTDPVTMCCREI